MNDYEIIIAELLKILNKQFVIFGVELSIQTVIIGLSIFTIVVCAIRKLYK